MYDKGVLKRSMQINSDGEVTIKGQEKQKEHGTYIRINPQGDITYKSFDMGIYHGQQLKITSNGKIENWTDYTAGRPTNEMVKNQNVVSKYTDEKGIK